MNLFFKPKLNSNYFIKPATNYYKFCQSQLRQLGQKGMTMIEIMIVLVIVGGLIAIVGPNVVNQLTSGRIDTAKIQIKELGKQLDIFYMDCHSYPDDLNSLMKAPSDCPSWGPQPYIKKIPKDPWGIEYVYELDGGNYVLKSLGSDKREGGTGSDKDISSADL